MADRILRGNILTSDPVNKLSWAAEIFYRRLMSVVDDYGRYEARLSVLRASLYPLKINQVSEADIAKWKAECANAGLVSFYEVDKKEYLEIQKFGQRLRAMKSRYPASADICGHLLTSAVKCSRRETEDETETEDESEGGLPPPAHTDEEKLLFRNFKEFIATKAQNVAKLKEPFTIDEYLKIKKKFSKEFVVTMIMRMHNYKPLPQKSVSAYLTFLNWSKKDFNEKTETNEQTGKPDINQALAAAGRNGVETN